MRNTGEIYQTENSCEGTKHVNEIKSNNIRNKHAEDGAFGEITLTSSSTAAYYGIHLMKRASLRATKYSAHNTTKTFRLKLFQNLKQRKHLSTASKSQNV